MPNHALSHLFHHNFHENIPHAHMLNISIIFYQLNIYYRWKEWVFRTMDDFYKQQMIVYVGMEQLLIPIGKYLPFLLHYANQ